MSALHDMHCHLGFATNAEEVAADAGACGSLLFSNTVTPEEWDSARRRFSGFENVTVGFGAHPWWASHAGRIAELLEGTDPLFIGEVGLDLGKRHAATRDEQIATFSLIARWAANRGSRVLSLHSVHASREVLDILERSGTLECCACIFHWFSGPSDQMKRAIDAGCFFSVGPRMLATGKGREYVKAIPADRLLLETDDPPREGEPYSFDALHAHLQTAASGIAQIKGDEALDVIGQTALSLLGKATGASSVTTQAFHYNGQQANEKRS